MRWLLFLAVASIPLLPTDGQATSCGFGCPYLHCPMFATRGLLGPVVEVGDDTLVLEVERASGRDAPEPGERITLDRKFFHYSDFEAGARLLVFLQGDRPSSELIPSMEIRRPSTATVGRSPRGRSSPSASWRRTPVSTSSRSGSRNAEAASARRMPPGRAAPSGPSAS
jgi:hypothetical protein